MEIHLNGERVEALEGARIRDLLPDRDPHCSVAVIRPLAVSSAQTRHFRITTTVGELVVEITGALPGFAPDAPDALDHLRLHWLDRYAAAFGPFPSGILPDKAAYRYERGDVILGCGGYDPARSYLIFAKMRHSADHGAPVGGGVVGRVVSGRSILDRWNQGDRFVSVERMLSSESGSESFTTRDDSLPLEDGMHIVTGIEAVVSGCETDTIDIRAAKSAEHFLAAMKDGHFVVGRAGSTHILDSRMIPTPVPPELIAARREGSITVRTEGRSSGGVYISTSDMTGSSAHTVVGRINRGLELIGLAQEGDVLCIRVEPERFDLVGLSLEDARAVAERRHVALTIDKTEGSRVVVEQKPATTLEVLAAGAATLSTRSLEDVIAIRLDDAHAPITTAIFREITGLKTHSVGKLPLFFQFEDVYLFKPSMATGVGIIPENTPDEEVPALSLAMTNDSRKGAGMVGVRTTSNSEFGPTSEPFTGTNIIGTVLDAEKLKPLKQGTMVFIREVRN
jgi:putative methanogenesis marker protein 3